MRIISICVIPVARILAIAYAVFGLVVFFVFALYGPKKIALPVGIVAPLVYLNVNFIFGRSTDVLYSIFLLFATVGSYALTGWLTGTEPRSALTL